ncbi:MAG: 30S ribosome-binding factor RbfA [Candidatus Omnitrophica bacterium]|nr:30S ribosome-binding factor RbfA [Candidatus Omnitrophota bacterium]
MGSNRPAKLAGTLKKKISSIIQTEIKDPRIGFVTITHVEVSADLRHVKVFFSVLGTEKEKKNALIGFKQATGFIRKLVAKSISLRYVPEIVFKFDETFEYGMRINELLERIKREDEQRAKRGAQGDKEPQ